MARTAVETANILTQLHDESFDGEEMEMFRIGWPELRGLAGASKLTEEYLAGINSTLAESQYALIPFDDYLVVAQQDAFKRVRQVPPRLLEQKLPNEDDFEIDADGDFELDDED